MRKIVAFLLTGLFFSIFAQPKIEIKNPWVRAVPPTLKNTALFMVIENNGNSPDVLIAVKTDICNKVMIHKTENSKGVMKMLHVDKLEIPSHSKVVFKPGSYHVMLMGLKKSINPGEKVKFTLIFDKSGAITIQAPVEMK